MADGTKEDFLERAALWPEVANLRLLGGGELPKELRRAVGRNSHAEQVVVAFCRTAEGR